MSSEGLGNPAVEVLKESGFGGGGVSVCHYQSEKSDGIELHVVGYRTGP
jgi:hypothetical protein